MTTTHEVQLAIYDLSGGMARSLSTQFLGPDHAIEIIPHTAIVVYGLEYYFGSGIASTPPTVFRQSRQIYPIQITTLGRTHLSKEQFESWCATVAMSGMYGPNSYDLLHRNCNNFSHDAAVQGLGLAQGVPQWILDVPRKFLSSPMGMLVRPILEGMQVTGAAGAGGGFNPMTGQFGTVDERAIVATASEDTNPWSNMTSNVTAPKDETKNNNNDEPKPLLLQNGPAETIPSILKQHDRFFLSDDKAVVNICIHKLSKNTTSDSDKALLQRLGDLLLNEDTGKTTEEEKETPFVFFNFLVSYINEDTGGGTSSSSSGAAFALMLLRLVILHPSCNAQVISFSTKEVGRKLIDENTTMAFKNSAAARSMAWCVLSNAVSRFGSFRSSLSNLFSFENNDTVEEGEEKACISLEAIYEAAMMDLSPENQKRVEVRQSASAFLYNIAHFLTTMQQRQQQNDDISDVIVLLLCGSLEGIEDEVDGTVQLRRLLVASKLIFSCGNDDDDNASVKALAIDLGFCDVLESLRQQQQQQQQGEEETEDMKKAKQLASEIQSILLYIQS